ncbi:E1-like protein-activating enzyme [Phanerochaete sordida]|uniref:Ubiquitin-like modifier-activating enzyme ATG7 n=1 Tax=Phanerochaete sordida TaxID=48140 RepID=A0A9P3GNK1_9APHY|nr:E1-like protein-activating enzyme [Phanerochaete sordida]
MTIIQFQPFSSLVEPAFWHALNNMKIDVLKLSDDFIPVTGSYAPGRSITDRESGQDIAMPSALTLAGDAFSEDPQIPKYAVPVTGLLKNYNTIEEFKAADKTALFNELSDEIWKSIQAGSTAKLTKFLLITFADLKKYRYYYWFAFPAFVAKPAWEAGGDWQSASEALSPETISAVHDALHTQARPFFLVRTSSATPEIAPIEELQTFFEGVPPEHRLVGFVDPSGAPSNPGWPLRNLLAYLSHRHPSLFSDAAGLRVLCWRDAARSRVGIVKGPSSAQDTGARPSAVGWEKNPQGKLAPRMADLAPTMDPKRLAEQAVDLNLKLMRWRILPELDLERVSNTRCLLLGAGTLGCYVARGLMAWGVRTITFVDSARVSFSNPVRQPLFTFEDCLDGGKPKAECAAENLKKIFPGVNATGHSLSIPMPGHPIPPASVEQTQKDVALLEQLFDNHDVIFLLMDSRESRWLPTVMGAAKGKIVMNAALGFDTFLVMRHGVRKELAKGDRLGCYYCNDIVAPADSLTDRTLDQMCTVTRPGLASIASSSAVELLAALLQHPDGVNAPAPAPPKNGQLPDPHASGSVLGLVPHQLRGYLAEFRTVPLKGAAFSRCTGCGDAVLEAYERDAWALVRSACDETGFLEKLSGLDELYREGEEAIGDVEWVDEEDDDM